MTKQMRELSLDNLEGVSGCDLEDLGRALTLT